MRLWAWLDSGQSLDLGDRFHTRERWSTRLGLVGDGVNVWVGPLHSEEGTISRLLAYSDGLAPLDGERSSWLKVERLQMQIANIIASPMSDDISVLEVRIAPEALASVAGDVTDKAPALATGGPRKTRQRWIDCQYRHAWLIPAILLTLSLVVLAILVRMLDSSSKELPVLPTVVPTAPPTERLPVTIPSLPDAQADPQAETARPTLEHLKDRGGSAQDIDSSTHGTLSGFKSV